MWRISGGRGMRCGWQQQVAGLVSRQRQAVRRWTAGTWEHSRLGAACKRWAAAANTYEKPTYMGFLCMDGHSTV